MWLESDLPIYYNHFRGTSFNFRRQPERFRAIFPIMYSYKHVNNQTILSHNNNTENNVAVRKLGICTFWNWYYGIPYETDFKINTCIIVLIFNTASPILCAARHCILYTRPSRNFSIDRQWFRTVNIILFIKLSGPTDLVTIYFLN